MMPFSTATPQKMKAYMMTIKGGEFWIAEITFTNGTASKKRPVLILWVDGEDVIVAVVTSTQPRTQTDVALNNWADSGLRLPSTVRLSRLDSLEKTLLRNKLGKVSQQDSWQLINIWEQHIKPQF
jgi:mRNA interferase MazF